MISVHEVVIISLSLSLLRVHTMRDKNVNCQLKNCTENRLCYLLFSEVYTHRFVGLHDDDDEEY